MSNSPGFSGDLLQSFSSSSSSSSSTAPHIPSDYLTTPDRSSWWLSPRSKRVKWKEGVVTYGKRSKIDKFVAFFCNDERGEEIIWKYKMDASDAIDKSSLSFPCLSSYIGDSAGIMRHHYRSVIDRQVPDSAVLEQDEYFHWDENSEKKRKEEEEKFNAWFGVGKI